MNFHSLFTSARIAGFCLLCFCSGGLSIGAEVKVGSKVFTESVLLGEIATQLGNANGVDTVHLKQFGGTRVLWEALLAGQIDAYPEYTGTMSHELLVGTSPESAPCAPRSPPKASE